MWTLLGERPIESLIDLPPMTDPGTQVVMGALASLFAKAFVTDHHLIIIILSRMVSLTLRHGFTDAAALGSSWFAVMSGTSFKRYREGHAWGLLARAFVDRYSLSAYRGGVLMGLQGISYWTLPLPAVQELTLHGFQQALQAGDFYFASYFAITIVTNRISMGHNLEDVAQEAAARQELVLKSGIRDAKDILVFYERAVQQLRGNSRSFGNLSGDGFEEQDCEAGLTPQRMSLTRASYWILKLQSRFRCGAYKEALQAAEKAVELLWCLNANLSLSEFHLYRALSLAGCFEESTPEEQRQSLVDIQRHQEQLAEWATHCPETFRAPALMVSGELARLAGRPDEATRAYEEAIRSARENGATHHLGLASELAANFWRSRQAPIVAHAFAREAWAAYQQWGATGKVHHLEAQWPHLLSLPATFRTDDTSSTDSTRIDALTVVKAQQAISGEIVLERLVTTLMQAAIENAGAQRGALLLPDGDTLLVAATSGASPGSVALPSRRGPDARAAVDPALLCPAHPRARAHW